MSLSIATENMITNINRGRITKRELATMARELGICSQRAALRMDLVELRAMVVIAYQKAGE